jgi:hypothetical protein
VLIKVTITHDTVPRTRVVLFGGSDVFMQYTVFVLIPDKQGRFDWSPSDPFSFRSWLVSLKSGFPKVCETGGQKLGAASPKAFFEQRPQ